MIILGIETSCDETSAAVVEDGKRLLSVIIMSSMDLHAVYGGVVPEIAARSHIEAIIPVIDQALAEAFSQSEERRKEKGESDSEVPYTPYSILPTPPTQSADPWDQIDGIAVTYGAGLGGSLLVGVMTARTLAITKNKSLYAINHVEAHIYANFLTSVATPRSKEQGARSKSGSDLTSYSLPLTPPSFPMLGLIVSGGHSQLVLWRDHFDYTLLGQTHDDAIGEAFDKVAKILGLPYPGGPSIGKKAQEGDPFAYKFPKAQMKTTSPGLEKLRHEMSASRSISLDGVQGSNEQRANRTDSTVSEQHKQLTQQSAKSNSGVAGSASQRTVVANTSGYDFSFSGIKTAVLRAAQQAIGENHAFPSHKLSERLSEAQKADIAASFQRIAVETVVDKTVLAYEEFHPKSVVIGGGVAASAELRRQLAQRLPLPIEYTDIKLCTDNGAMVATLGCYKAMLNQETADPYSLEIAPNLSM